MNNHIHAHSVYYTNCPKCQVIFTHDTLLHTHLKAKCSKEIIKEEKEESKPSEEELNSSSVLSHLSSTLPLLTLLQIQKKQEEQKLQEQSEGYASEGDENLSEEEQHESKAALASHPPPPPLIPSNMASSPHPKLVMLKHLLSNVNKIQQSFDDSNDDSKENEKESEDESSQVKEEESANNSTKTNIPDHLYHLLNKDLTKGEKPDSTDQNTVMSEEEVEKKTTRKRKSRSSNGNSELSESKRPKAKRLRRRTTVFTEAQHRILYLHFTHCNFPDPAMFRILSKLTGLTPHVIKIWFQNERSRQRRQVSITESEGKISFLI